MIEEMATFVVAPLVASPIAVRIPHALAVALLVTLAISMAAISMAAFAMAAIPTAAVATSEVSPLAATVVAALLAALLRPTRRVRHRVCTGPPAPAASVPVAIRTLRLRSLGTLATGFWARADGPLRLAGFRSAGTGGIRATR